MATTANQTSILTLCHCGWVGMDSSTQRALQGWHDHAFNSRGGMHERVGDMAIANPLNALGLYRIRQEAMEQARLARWKSYEKEHGEFVTLHAPLAVAERRLRDGALNAMAVLGIAGGIALIVMGLWRAF